jgi:UDP-N-acetyl-D-mannosaminuronic acid dehydrogenase
LPQIVGGYSNSCTAKAAGFWSTLTNTIVRVDSLEAAELVKLVNNSFRDLSFAFSNGLALLADRYNLDAARLIAAANEGYPRNPMPRPSPGVGGYCLTKDPFLYAVADLQAAYAKLSTIGREVNRQAGLYPVDVLERYAERLGSPVSDMRVLLIGMAYKGLPETNDLRRSTAIDVAQALSARGCSVECYDAVASIDELRDSGLSPISLIAGLKEADAVMILNNHPNNVPDGFLEIVSDRPILLFDGWNLLDREEVEKYPRITYATLGYMTSNNHESDGISP